LPLPSAVSVLRHRNFRLIWIGLLLSFTETKPKTAIDRLVQLLSSVA